jgi:predicted MFS family arabinose efflux permease
VTTEATATTEAAPGIRGLLGISAFRGIAIANTLVALAFGSSRFVFVWLIGELTEWNPATAILGILLGMPHLFLSAWAGSLVDRLPPRQLGLALMVAGTGMFTVTAILVDTRFMTVPVAMACGFFTAIAPAMLTPLLQAIVPSLVPPQRLMQAVAIQNLGMMVATIGGAFIGGGVIQLFGISAGFWMLAIASCLAALRYMITPLPDQLAGANQQRRGAIRDGARAALGSEPLRSLLAVTFVMGIAITSSVLLLPEFARDVLGKESFAAGALNAFMSIGMMGTSFVLATRWTPSRPGLVLTIVAGLFLGGGLVAIGLSQVYVLTAIFAFMWGMSGGIAMTLLRTLTQVNTPPELMGRVMGLAAMAQNGAFPIGSLMLFGLVSITSVSSTMVISGVICTAAIWSISIRPHIRRL